MSNLLRLFIAVELPELVKQEIVRIQATLKQEHCFEGTYVDPKQAHITMKFIGSVSAYHGEAIKKALASISFNASCAQLGNVDLFCSDDTIKIVYVHVIAPELPLLAAALDTQLLDWCKPEDRTFTSHVTLARVKWVADKQYMRNVIAAFAIKPIGFEVNSFVLMQSILTQLGPEYKTLATFKI
jgi:2'-5' RNA ligase